MPENPERKLFSEPLNFRAIQIGLSGPAVKKYLTEWIVSIEYITEHIKEIHSLTKTNIEKAIELLPKEKCYSIPENTQQIVEIKI